MLTSMRASRSSWRRQTARSSGALPRPAKPSCTSSSARSSFRVSPAKRIYFVKALFRETAMIPKVEYLLPCNHNFNSFKNDISLIKY